MTTPATSACAYCRKHTTLKPCVACGRLCCGHFIRPQPKPDEVGKVGLCAGCRAKVPGLKPLRRTP